MGKTNSSTIKIACLLVGTIVGAGFASGKEIVRFFAFYPEYSVLVAIALVIVFFFVAFLFLQIGKILKPNSFDELTKAVFGRASIYFDIFMALSYLIIFAAMLAGVDSLFADSFGLGKKFPIYSVIILVIAIFTLNHGFKALKWINLFIAPAIIAIILFINLYAYANPIGVVEPIAKINIFGFISNILLYVSLNMLLASSVMCFAGDDSNNTKINFTGALVGALTLGMSVLVVLLGVFSAGSDIFSVDMPILLLSKNLPYAFTIFSSIIILLGIFTTVTSSLYPLIKYTEKFIPKKIYVYLLLSVLGILFKSLGFAVIVDYSFPIMGGVGIVFIVFSAVYYFKNAKTVKNLT